MDNKLWVLVPYMRPVRNSRRWQAEPWKGAPPAKIDGMLVFSEPETALASHLEGVNIAGRLNEYIRGIEEKGWSRSKKTRDRKAGLAKVLPAMEAWDGYAKYASVQQVMEAVKSSQSSWQDTPDSPTKRAKRGGADTTEGSGGVGGEIKDTRATADPPTKRGGAGTTEGSGGGGGELKDLLESISIQAHALEQLKQKVQAQLTSAGVGADTIALRVSAKRKADVLEGKANDTQTSTNTDTIRL